MAQDTTTERNDPPAALRFRLEKDEALVWRSRGSGRRIDFTVVVLLAAGITVFGTFIGVLAVGRVPESLQDWLFGILLGAAVFLLPLAAASAYCAFFAPRFEIYGLTGRRVIRTQVLLPFIGNSVVPASERHLWRPPIRRIRVMGNESLGSVRLRGLEGPDHRSASPFILSGVSHPLKVAQLIKSTLKLDLSIEDRTR